MKDRIQSGFERERKIEPLLEKISRILWPWREYKLVLFVSLLAVLDYVSTFAALELSGNPRIIEAGPLAGWALETGGFIMLFIVDVISIGALVLIALGVRALYIKLGFRGFARAALVFLLTPYAIIIMAVVINNVIVTFQ